MNSLELLLLTAIWGASFLFMRQLCPSFLPVRVFVNKSPRQRAPPLSGGLQLCERTISETIYKHGLSPLPMAPLTSRYVLVEVIFLDLVARILELKLELPTFERHHQLAKSLPGNLFSVDHEHG
jgi:hypothetical protein